MAPQQPTAASTPRPKVEPGEPGYALGVAGFITSFIWGIVGIVLSAVGLSQSKRINKGNTLAFAGLIIGIVQTVLSTLVIAGMIAAGVALANYCTAHPNKCQDSSNTQVAPDGSSDPSATPNRTY